MDPNEVEDDRVRLLCSSESNKVKLDSKKKNYKKQEMSKSLRIIYHARLVLWTEVCVPQPNSNVEILIPRG